MTVRSPSGPPSSTGILTSHVSLKVDTQYRKFARLLLGFETLLLTGWREQAETVLGRMMKQLLLQNNLSTRRCVWVARCR